MCCGGDTLFLIAHQHYVDDTLHLVLPHPLLLTPGVNCSPTPIAASCPAITNVCLISKALPLSKRHRNGTTKHVDFSGGFLSCDNVFKISHVVAHTNNMHLFTAEMYSGQRYTKVPLSSSPAGRCLGCA